MNTGVISMRYAKAFYELTAENGSSQKVYGQVQDLLAGQQPDNLAPELESLVRLLVKNGRLDLTKYIFESYSELYRSNAGLIKANLTVATESKELENKLHSTLSRMFDGELQFNKKVDPGLIGGFVLEIDDKVLDTSVRNQLALIRAKFDEMNKRLV